MAGVVGPCKGLSCGYKIRFPKEMALRDTFWKSTQITMKLRNI